MSDKVETSQALLSPKEAAGILNISEKALLGLKDRGLGPEFFKVSRKCIRYSREAVQKYLSEISHDPKKRAANG